MKSIARAALAALCLGVLGLSGGGASAQSGLTTLRVGVIPAVVSAQAYVANDLGLFKKQGLDVQFMPMNAGVSTASALVGGSLDIAFADVVAMSSAHAHGVPVVFIAPGPMDATRLPIVGLIVKGDGPRQAKDLDGKTIAVNALRSMATVTTSAWVDGNGGDSKTLRFVEYPIPQMAAALAAGTVDAALPPEPFVTSALESGDRMLLFERNGVHDYMIAGWIATPTWLAANAETVKKFLAALREASDYVNRRPLPSDAAAVISKYTKIPVPVVEHISHLSPFGTTLDPRQIQPIVDASAKYGVIDKPFPAAELVGRAK